MTLEYVFRNASKNAFSMWGVNLLDYVDLLWQRPRGYLFIAHNRDMFSSLHNDSCYGNEYIAVSNGAPTITSIYKALLIDDFIKNSEEYASEFLNNIEEL